MPILGILASSKLTAAAGDFESIATVTVGSGGAADVQFTSIPAGFAHLQIRGFAKSNSGAGSDILRIRLNADTGNNYARHILYGTGTSAASSGTSSGNLMTLGNTSTTASVFSAHIVDILDYANTNKYTTIKSLNGSETNSIGESSLSSGLWMNTNAVTSITIFMDSASNVSQYSHFALYGIKSA